MTEPTTEAGRALIAAYPGNALDASTPEFIRHMARTILAIEAEARAAEPPALDADVLALAFRNAVADAEWVIVDYSRTHKGPKTMPGLRLRLMRLVAAEYARLAREGSE